MTIGPGAAVVPTPGGAGVVTPNVTVMIVIFTLNVILFLLSHPVGQTADNDDADEL